MSRQETCVIIIGLGLGLIAWSVLAKPEPDYTISPDMASYRKHYGQVMVFSDKGVREGEWE